MQPFLSLPNRGQIFFKNSAGTVITSAPARWGPLTSTYAGVEVEAADVKNTAIFVCYGFSQRRLATKIVYQGHYIWVDAAESYLITGLKDFGSHTEFIGLRQSLTQAFQSSDAVGLVSEWAFKSSATLTTDEKGLNTLTNTNSVAFSTDKPTEVPFDIGSAAFTAASSMRLEIANASQLLLDLTGSYTIAFRVKLTTAPSSVNGLIGKGTTGAGNLGYYFYISNSTNKVEVELSNDGTATTQCIGATLMTSGVWYSFASVYNGTDVRNYLNGSLDTSGTANPKAYTSGIYDNSQKFTLGCRGDNSQFLNGKLAHVFVFNQAKTAAEVASWHLTDVWS